MSEQASIRLITRGDDLGAFQSVNRGILAAYQQGILRNTSIMAPAPAFEEAVEMVKGEKGLCVGLHITLNSEWESTRWGPVAPPETVPSLLDGDGCFFRHPGALYEHGVNPDEVMREIQAQLDLVRAKGLDVRYIDDHMGVIYFYRSISRDLEERVRELARKEGLLWYVDSQARLLPSTYSHDDLDATVRLKQQLPGLEAGTYLLITHPAYDTEEMRAIIHAGNPRGREASLRAADLRMLCDSEIARMIQQRSIEVIRFDEVQAG